MQLASHATIKQRQQMMQLKRQENMTTLIHSLKSPLNIYEGHICSNATAQLMQHLRAHSHPQEYPFITIESKWACSSPPLTENLRKIKRMVIWGSSWPRQLKWPPVLTPEAQ